MHILVTGKNGQLGSEINAIANQYKNHSFSFADSNSLDISKKEMIQQWVIETNCELIINCAAYTAVDKAEEDIETCEKVNVLGVQNLVDTCEEFNIKLIHISTDYVFDGSKNTPYNELDKPNPQGIYGSTKLKGEKIIEESKLQAIIIRTSWVYSKFGNNFVKTMVNLGKERASLNVVFDQIGTPTNAADLAKACLEIVEQKEKWSAGVTLYHFSNEGVASWYDFAKEIMQLAKLKCEINPIESKDYPTKAKRPHFSVLNKAKIKTDFNLSIPYWKASLLKMLVD